MTKSPRRYSAVFIALFALILALPAWGQVLNGDFSAGMDHWVVVQPPDTVVPGQVAPIDIDSSGPLGTSDAFYAHVGWDSLRNLQQIIYLEARTTYNFRADIAKTVNMYNLDQGSISVFVADNSVASISFGAGNGERYATLSGVYTPMNTGDQLLSINFSRGYIASENTAVLWIDNVEMTAVMPAPEPSSFCIALCGTAIFCLNARWRHSKSEREHSEPQSPVTPRP